ncbi:BTB and MATH domain-containing protein 36-like [Oculina patagonica]
MASTGNSSAGSPDFSAQWKFSDVILVVEEQRFHVHRSTLAIWSPVFETMFTADFKEKNSDEISLPGKKASEIKELLQIMYDTSLDKNVVTESNCYFLLDLAHEYQIASITQKCEDFLVYTVKKKGNDVLAGLIAGQKYELKTLVKTCLHEARLLKLHELNSKRDEIEPDNYRQITDKIIERLEKENDRYKALLRIK